MFQTKKTLIVVYKDELLMNQLKKLVETNDDGEEYIVGTRDNSINIVSWTEKVWLDNKKAGNIQGKILFLGEIKGTDKLIPVLDLQFNDSGVKYGWAGNQAVLFADPKQLENRRDYDSFLRKFYDMPVPEFLKTIDGKDIPMDTMKETEDISQHGGKIEISEEESNMELKRLNIFRAAQKAIINGVEVVGKVGNHVAAKTEEIFRNKDIMKRQMLFYGVIHLYENNLESFMNQ